MKSYGGLYDRITSFDNLMAAARSARRGKRFKPQTARFHHRLESEILDLQEELRSWAFRPGPYRQFRVYEPKERLISAAPYRDRVVHHAVIRVIEPLLDPSFVFDTYACRQGKGQHRALMRFQGYLRRNAFVLKTDIVKYFPSVDHEILKALLFRKIRCPGTRWLLGTIIDSSPPQESPLHYFRGDDLFTPVERRRGIPIGNLTSQFFANFYLSGLDHFVGEKVGCQPRTVRYPTIQADHDGRQKKVGCDGYVRYMDDIAVFGASKDELQTVRHAMEDYLEGLRLKLHPRKSRIWKRDDGITYLGYRVWPWRIGLTRSGTRRFRGRLKELREAYGTSRIGVTEVRQSVRSWIGHARWADSERLTEKLLADAVFDRAA